MNLAAFTRCFPQAKHKRVPTPDLDAVTFAGLHFPSRAYCLVADWVILISKLQHVNE
jgi:hypothetical protein